MTRRLVVFGTAVMTTMLALVVLWQFRIVVVYVLISLAVAATVRPLVRGWSRRSLATRLALILLYLVSLGTFGYLVFIVGRFAIGAIQQAAQTLSAQGNWRLPLWLEGSSFQRLLITWLPTPAKLLEALTGDQGQRVLPVVLGFTEGVGSAVSGAFIVLFLSLYWSINQVHFERLWLSLIPSELRMHARDVWRTIELDVGAYIRSEVAQSLLAGLLLGLGYWLLGSPYPALLALIGALAWLIPVVGPALVVVLVLVMGLMTSVQLSLFTALYTLVILIALQVWVGPRFLKSRLDNPILTLVIVLAMADAFGVIGIIVAPPVSAVCQILWNHLVSNSNAARPAAKVSDLKERQAHLAAAIQEMEEPPPPLVSSSMERLTDLLEKAEPILQAALPAEVFGLANPVQPFAAADGSPPSPKL
jgi:predicted PurR-regulated permease PerM